MYRGGTAPPLPPPAAAAPATRRRRPCRRRLLDAELRQRRRRTAAAAARRRAAREARPAPGLALALAVLELAEQRHHERRGPALTRRGTPRALVAWYIPPASAHAALLAAHTPPLFI
ncbi:hypothetical protein GGX14DRAFT_556802 [Mycena pura]|uniref:Uncharacterized protein n=1 Tax=Mycena pura TaxID=153505 RepID=A0AAD7E3C5_9AGAR|nr:hypothetical protein GGX14DRAFT_556802 [Mycena pura]